MNDFFRGLLNLPIEASTYAHEIDLLHFFVIASTMLGAAFIFLLALYFGIRYRRRVAGETTLRTGTSTPLEVAIVGSLLTLFLAFWVIGAVQYNHMFTPPPDAISVYVTGKQWMWEFSYADGRSSMDVLTVPVHRPIKLVMTSRDVIHSFYVPAFRMKHDVVPGRYYTAWFEATMPGLYDIDCAEYCGVDHSRMLGKVRVLDAADYGKWLESTTPGPNLDLVARGRDTAARYGCINCHTLDGQRHIGPSWAGLYHSMVRLQDGRSVYVDEAYLTRSMMDPLADVVTGYNAVMPSYRGLLEQPEVAALVELIKSIQTTPEPVVVTLPQVAPLGSGQPQEPKP
jgi:cytochrome c oxidase subunit 2